MHPFHKRLLKEYKSLQRNLLPGITLLENANSAEPDITDLTFAMTLPPDADGVLHPIYKSNIYHIRIIATKDYPVDSPQVQFVTFLNTDSIPVHPHVYSNGHICLDILGTGWTPACSFESILLSLQSMLSTNEVNERPPDNQGYVKRAPLNPKNTTFVYHDDNV